MTTIKKLLRKLVEWLQGEADVPDPIRPDPVKPAPDGKRSPKPAAICEPERGVECYNPFGLDIRALAWSPSKGDWVFVACNAWARAIHREGQTIRADPEWTRNGVRYVCAGHKEPRSDNQLKADLSGTYQTTMRWYYWPTREAAQ